MAFAPVDRREFLRLSAMAGAAAVLSQCSSGSSKAKATSTTTTALPKAESVLAGTAAESGIDTVVVAMMENRSFDSYYGWLARDDRVPRGRPVEVRRAVRGRRQLVPGVPRRRRSDGEDRAPRRCNRCRALARLRIQRPRARVDGGPRRTRRRVPRQGQRQRRVRALVLRGDRIFRSTTCSLAVSRWLTAGTRRCSGRHTRTASTCSSGAVGWQQDERVPTGDGFHVADDRRPAQVGERSRRRVLQRLADALPLGLADDVERAQVSTTSRPTRPRASCRTSRS